MSAVLPPDPLGIVTSILFERLVEFLDEDRPLTERMTSLNRPERPAATAPDPRPGRAARPKRMHRVRQ
jgi:hypothetical protein